MTIFDYIMEHCQLDFISDIRRLGDRQLYDTIRHMEYVGTAKEWNDLISYLTNQSYTMNNPKEYLLTWLEQRMKDVKI